MRVTATLEAPAASELAPDEPEFDDSPPVARRVPAALQPWHDPHPLLGWLVPLVLGVIAGFTRFWALGFPNSHVFDEVYYATEAQEILRYGYEDNRDYMFIVHPPLGKWMIGLGQLIFNNNPANTIGWRFMGAVVGTLSVVIIARIARRMFRSNLFGAIAGALLLMEGLSLVLARTALLDIYLQFFVLCGFGALVVDRDKMRARLRQMLLDGVDLSLGATPSLGPRPWRVFAGVLLGCACAVKWTGAYFFIGFVFLHLLWDRAAFRAAGARRPMRPMWRRSILPGIGSLLLVPIGTYLLTYIGWFTGENSWNRHYADSHSASSHFHLLGLKLPIWWGWVPPPIRSLGAYTLDAYRFHTGLDSYHPYRSSPWSWLVLGRPIDFYYDGSSHACGASQCSRTILAIGTPLMWWAFVPMLLWLAWHWLTTRDWRAGAVWMAFIAGWVVWFSDLKRTMFFFYMAPLVPFLIIGLTLGLGVILGPAVRRTGAVVADNRMIIRRNIGIGIVSAYLAVVIADFVWMWPIYTGALRTLGNWHAHMWLPSWV